MSDCNWQKCRQIIGAALAITAICGVSGCGGAEHHRNGLPAATDTSSKEMPNEQAAEEQAELTTRHSDKPVDPKKTGGARRDVNGQPESDGENDRGVHESPQ